MGSKRSWIVSMAILAFVAVLLGMTGNVLARYTRVVPPNMFLSIMVILVALITLFGTLYGGLEQDEVLDESDIRRSITLSMVASYLVIVGIVAFFSTTREDDRVALAPAAEVMLTSFTTLLGIIVPFYFGTSAYLEVKKKQSEGTAEVAPDTNA